MTPLNHRILPDSNDREHVASERRSASPRSFAPQATLLDYARRARAARARHSVHFPKGLFRDRAWDIMIELFIATGEGRRLCAKDAMHIAEDSPAASVRRIDALETAGLVQRMTDEEDHRRILLRLTERGHRSMSGFLSDLYLMEGAQVTPLTAQEPSSFKPPSSGE